VLKNRSDEDLGKETNLAGDDEMLEKGFESFYKVKDGAAPTIFYSEPGIT
jgi:hypothetical protein